MLRGLMKQRDLLASMAKREIWGRYKGSTMGIAWSLVTPLLMLVVYTAVFGGIFKARWGGTGTTTEFALNLFCGLILHGLLSDCLSRSPTKLIEHANYVKKVVFPLEILPVIVVSSALFHTLISMIVLLVAAAFLNGGLHWTILALPAVLAPLLLLCLGISWFLSALTVFIRDISQMTGLISALLLFLSPIFYPISMIPEPYRALMALNPLTTPVEQLRLIVMVGQWPDWITLGQHTLIGLVAAWAGYAWFQKTRKGFADVL